MECPLCKKNVEGSVCRNCGCVLEEMVIDYRPIKSLNRNSGEKEYRNEFLSSFSPNIRHTHKHPRKVSNPDLKRAFRLERKIEKRDEKDLYLKAYLSLKKYCSILNLPTHIVNEAVGIYKEIVKKERNFFRKNGVKPSYLAFIKIACEIREFPLLNSKIMKLVDYKTIEKRRTVAYMDKKFNKSYIEAKRLLNLHFLMPKHPKYIDYVALVLNLPYKCATVIHKIFSNLRKYLNINMRIDGYILALYYIKFRKEYKFTLDHLEEVFEVSAETIRSKRREINKKWELEKGK